jgi:putative tryptophan/tyrosine transport system substrate-binding protein
LGLAYEQTATGTSPLWNTFPLCYRWAETFRPGDQVTAFIGRREVITLLGGAAAAWPLTARAQQPHRMRRIGVLMAIEGNDPERQVRITALKRGLEQAGWIEGHNVQIEVRRGGGTENIRKNAAEMVASAPDIILCSGTEA